MSELKPCPFCKCTEIVAGKDYTRDYYRVDCLGCSAFITAPSLELAIQYWNTRPIEDKLQAEIDRLKAERRWIPVSERLPEERVDVLVVSGCEVGIDEVIGGYFMDYNQVTHWMPPPAEPPSEEEC